MLNVALDELPDQLKELVVTAVSQYQEKCLLSFTRTRDKKVYEKTLFPRVILEGEHDPTVQIQHQVISELLAKP